MKTVQYFTDEYLQQCRGASADEILHFLENFRLLQQPAKKSKLISIKVPETLLESFCAKCKLIMLNTKHK